MADDIGRKLGVDEIASELLPEDKLEFVSRLTKARHNVVMVGDGANDAPALMKATVGIAMGAGTDVARETANVVLIGNDLSKLVETVWIARRCHRTIMQNFVGTLLVDSIGIGLAAFEFLNPLVAAFIHGPRRGAHGFEGGVLCQRLPGRQQVQGVQEKRRGKAGAKN